MPLKPENVVCVVDSREQFPFDLSPMKAVRKGLATGDYSVRGLEDYICLERKELSDLVTCIGVDRQRFKRELKRMQAYPARAVIVEASWADLASGSYRSRLSPASATSSLAAWIGQYSTPFMLLGDRENAQEFAKKFLFHSARRWYEMAEIFKAAQGENGAHVSVKRPEFAATTSPSG